jgi:DNA-binding transcriptional LysR family regulator
MYTSEIGLLRSFLVLMAERNVSRAAQRLGISQPATSHALARLRTLFGDPLLLRSRNGMLPTTRAGDIERLVRTLLEDYDRLVLRTQAFEPLSSRRTFVLTAPEYAEHLLMPPLFRRLRAEAPNVHIEFRAPRPEKAYELLESGEVDVRIAWLTKPLSSLRSMQLFQDRLACIADRNHPSVRGSVTLEQFLSLPHARTFDTSHTTTNRVIDSAVERYGRKLQLSFQVQNFLTIPLTLLGADIIATLPRTLALAFAKQYPLQVCEPPLRLPRVRYAAYWHERNQKDAGHKWLRAVVREAAGTLAG